MKRVLGLLWTAWVTLGVLTIPPAKLAAQTSLVPDPSQVVRREVLNPNAPIFVPVHPRIATTVSFPKPIGEPMGTGFVDSDVMERAAAEGRPLSGRAEYLISFVQGDTFFSVQPLQKAELLNLNVPCEGHAIVLYFYVVENPLEAIASLIFEEAKGAGIEGNDSKARRETSGNLSTSARLPSSVERRDSLPTRSYIPVTPARIEGFLRKLRLVHAAKVGDELSDVAQAMKVVVAVSKAEGVSESAIVSPISDSGTFELILLRAVREPRMDALGFVVLARNKSDQEILLDVRTFSARCGAAFYTAAAVDASPSLKAGEVRAVYFVVVGAGDQRPGHLSPHNDWRISVNTLPLAAVSPPLKKGIK